MTEQATKERKVGDVVSGWKIVAVSEVGKIVWARDGKQGTRFIVDRKGGKQGGLTRCHTGTITDRAQAMALANKK